METSNSDRDVQENVEGLRGLVKSPWPLEAWIESLTSFRTPEGDSVITNNLSDRDVREIYFERRREISVSNSIYSADPKAVTVQYAGKEPELQPTTRMVDLDGDFPHQYQIIKPVRDSIIYILNPEYKERKSGYGSRLDDNDYTQVFICGNELLNAVRKKRKEIEDADEMLQQRLVISSARKEIDALKNMNYSEEVITAMIIACDKQPAIALRAASWLEHVRRTNAEDLPSLNFSAPAIRACGIQLPECKSTKELTKLLQAARIGYKSTL